MRFKEKYLIFLVIIGLLVIGLYYSYAIFVTKQLQENVVSLKTVDVVKLSVNDASNKFTLRGNTKENIKIKINNMNTIDYFYEIYFKSDKEKVLVFSSSDMIKNVIKSNEEKIISVNVDNRNLEDVHLEFIIKIGMDANIDKEIGYSYINKEANYDHSHANKPEIKNNYLIPVLYYKENDTEGYWYKTDSDNQNNFWYDYDHGIWANSVLVSESNYQKYQNMKIGSKVSVEDILGFYVWIPRFKYTILNGSSYTSFERTNNIIFENNNESTGTISCYDKVSNNIDKHFYSEVCQDKKYLQIYDNLSTYTHPAFQNNKGFWVAKFLVNDSNRSIPNTVMAKVDIKTAIKNSENIGNQAHLLTNMEYASVILLSNSFYGKSGNNNYFSDDNYTFKRIYNNNYLYDLTGCSSDYNNYSKNFNNNTSKVCIAYNDFTNYTHYANSLNYLVGEVGPGASSTGTIYGVYDLANIYGELVSSFVADINGNIEVEPKVYDRYSYNDYLGKVESSKTAVNLYRYKLGDAIKENFRTLSENGMWQGGLLEQRVNSGVFLRGGNGDIKNASIYTASIVDYQYNAPFRVSLW